VPAANAATASQAWVPHLALHHEKRFSNGGCNKARRMHRPGLHFCATTAQCADGLLHPTGSHLHAEILQRRSICFFIGSSSFNSERRAIVRDGAIVLP